MSVVLYKVTHLDFFGQGEKAALFLTGYLAILLIGPGKVSVDGMIGK
jgi:putative oxidoreductase